MTTPFAKSRLLVVEGHRITEIVVAVGYPPAVEANILRISGEFLNFINLVIADQHT